MSKFEHVGASEDVYRFESREEAAEKMNVPKERLDMLLRNFPHIIDGDVLITSYMHGGRNQTFALRPVNRWGVHPPVVAKFYNDNPILFGGNAMFGLHREKNFLRHLERNNISCVPRVLGYDLDAKIGLYTYVEGSHKRPGEMVEEDALQMVNFMWIVNHSGLPVTSIDQGTPGDYRYGVYEHIMSARDRLESAGGGVEAIIGEGGDLDLAIEGAVLHTQMQQVFDTLMKAAEAGRLGNTRVLSSQELLPCPMDVGFHNTLFTPEGEANFIDFEEVGWQDSVYQFANFYMHPRFQEVAQPIKKAALEMIVAILSDEGDALERLPAALVFSNLEWSARMLESLSPQRRETRLRASPGLDWEAFKNRTLDGIKPLAWTDCAELVPGIDELKALVSAELQRQKTDQTAGLGGRLLYTGMLNKKGVK